MSPRARWIVLGVALVLVLGVVVLYWFNTNLTGVTVEESSGRRMWIVQGGDTFKLSADEVGPDDRYRCEVDGGAYTVKGTPPLGRALWAGDFLVATIDRGAVILTCDPNAAVP